LDIHSISLVAIFLFYYNLKTNVSRYLKFTPENIKYVDKVLNTDKNQNIT